MTTLKTGDEVRVFRGRHYDDPEGGIVAKVTKAGRKWGTATYEVDVHDWRGNTARREETIEFGLENGYERGDHYGNGFHVLTLEMLDRRNREHAAVAALKAAGIDVRHTVSLELLEALASVTEQFKTSTEGET